MQAVLHTLKILDLQPLHDVYRGTGSAAYPPELMLAIALVEILNGQTSPARWFRDATTRDQCKFVGRGISPSRTAWYDFRDRAGKFIDSVHQQLVNHAIDQQLIAPKECAIDGTFSAAAASRHKIYNLKQINRRLNPLKRAIQMLDAPEQIAAQTPLSKIPRWIAPTPIGRNRQLTQFRLAKRRMLENIGENRLKYSRYRRDESRLTISPTDIDAVIGKDKSKVIRPLYNTQTMADCGSEMIVAFDVWAQANDTGTLIPMVKKTQQIVGGVLETVHADSSYCSILELKDCQSLGVELLAPVQDNTQEVNRKSISGQKQIASSEFVFQESSCRLTCPQGHDMKLLRTAQVPRADGRRLGQYLFEQSVEYCQRCPLASRCLSGKAKQRKVSRQVEQPLLDLQIKKMASERGKRSQRLRAQTIERRFADGKRHRGQGQQNGRGLLRVKAEVGLLVLAQNTLTLYNLIKNKETEHS